MDSHADRRAENLRAELRRLRDHCSACGECGRRAAQNGKLAHVTAQTMPLTHTTPTSVLRRITDDNALRSQASVGGAGATHETELSTANSVFFFAGPARYICDAPCAFYFTPSLERNHADADAAAAFDTGAWRSGRVVVGGVTNPQADDLRRIELPVPGYRNALGATLGMAFARPLDYLDDAAVIACEKVLPAADHGGADARRWTFEIRFRESVRLDQPSLHTVLVPSAQATNDRLLALASRSEAAVQVEPYDIPNGTTPLEAFRRMDDRIVRGILDESLST